MDNYIKVKPKRELRGMEIGVKDICQSGFKIKYYENKHLQTTKSFISSSNPCHI